VPHPRRDALAAGDPLFGDPHQCPPPAARGRARGDRARRLCRSPRPRRQPAEKPGAPAGSGPAPRCHYEGRRLPQEHARRLRRCGRAMARRPLTSLVVGRILLRGASGVSFALILMPIVFVSWLSFFKNELLTFPPAGYTLRWFWVMWQQSQFADG